ncbi:MAG: M3 family peptidase, partial [Planctomycetota bacterium]
MSASVLLEPWKGPHGGVPPWNLVNPNEFVEAFESAITDAKREIESIALQQDAPTFGNTLVRLEQSGDTLDRLEAIFGVYSGNLNLGPIGDIERVIAPKLAA